MALEANQSYTLQYAQIDRPTNISFNGTFYGLKPNDYLIIKFLLSQIPDIVKFDLATQLTQAYYPLTYLNDNGDWYWDNDTFELSFIVTNKLNIVPFVDYSILFSAVKCRYATCLSSVNPSFKLPVTSRPKDAQYWSNLTTWNFNQLTLPKDNESIIIPNGKYIIVDCPLPKFKILQIEGTVELDNGINHRLEASIIAINGGQLIIGWENNPILTNVEIVLNGDKGTDDYRLPDGLSFIGNKAIGVYGGLDIHGKPNNISWTRLNETIRNGSNTLRLVEPVDWRIGDQIVITTTTFNLNHTDVLTIVALSNDSRTLTLNDSVKYDHIAYRERLPTGTEYHIAAGVGLLTRNVKIIGAGSESDLYGFRIIVSDYSISINGIPTNYKGYARISNVEFFHPGQFSLDTADDSKYGILFSNLGDYNSSRPSYVKSSSFNDGYSCAVGIFGSNGIPIENNVIYRAYRYGLNIQGRNNIIRRNLVALIFSNTIAIFQIKIIFYCLIL